VTDRPDSPESEDSAEIAEVRRLLAGARHADPMPDDVAARMDDVLAGLRDTPQTSPATRPHPSDAEVVPIAAHRRRRAAGLLAAAAAIVVGGVVVAPHVHVHSGGSSAATTAEDSTAGGRELGNTGNSKNPLAPQARGNGKAHLHDGRIVVRPQHFSADARAGRQLLGPSASMSAGGDTDCRTSPSVRPRWPRSTSTRPPRWCTGAWRAAPRSSTCTSAATHDPSGRRRSPCRERPG